MTAAKRRQFDLVLCWKLDRFGRSLRHLVNALAELEAPALPTAVWINKPVPTPEPLPLGGGR